MARQVDFEDMDSRDWPADLAALRLATQSAKDAGLFLDEALKPKVTWEEREPLLTLWQQAYKLYKSLQAMGLARLAEVQTKHV